MPAHAQRMSSLLALDKGADCRVARRVYEAARGAACGRGAEAAQAACMGRTRLKDQMIRAERTPNMLHMFLTLDVSKLSG